VETAEPARRDRARGASRFRPGLLDLGLPDCTGLEALEKMRGELAGIAGRGGVPRVG
jgi:hypothetical protein